MRWRPAVRPDAVATDRWIALLTLPPLLLWDASGLDLQLVRWFGGPDGFAWREHWLTAGLLHGGGRALGALLLVLALGIALRPVGPWRALVPRVRWAALGVVVAGLLLIPLLKRASLSSCPWSLLEFGGAARYVSHWRWGVADGGPGHCFPSGHASGAFAFLPLATVLRGSHPRLARALLLSLLMLGAVFGAAQTLRGAHYPSHTLWTAWLCWALSALAAPWLRPAEPATVAARTATAAPRRPAAGGSG